MTDLSTSDIGGWEHWPAEDEYWLMYVNLVQLSPQLESQTNSFSTSTALVSENFSLADTINPMLLERSIPRLNTTFEDDPATPLEIPTIVNSDTTMPRTTGMQPKRPHLAPRLTFEANNINKSSCPSLSLLFAEAERAVKSGHATKRPHPRNVKSMVHKFHGKLQTRGQKQQGLKRTKIRPCWSCRFAKQKCSQSPPCDRGMERHLCQRGLAFRACWRNPPVNFNPFFVETPHIAEIEGDSNNVLWFSRRIHKSFTPLLNANGHASSSIAALIFEIYHQRHNVCTEQLDKIEHFATLQTKFSEYALCTLGDAVRPEISPPDRVTYYRNCFSLAAQLLTWLCLLEKVESNIACSDRAIVCRQYLLEYIDWLLPKRFSAGTYQYTAFCTDLVDPRAQLIGPQARLAAVEGAVRALLPKSLATEGSRSDQIELERNLGDEWPMDSPRYDDAIQMIGVWSLFYNTILGWMDCDTFLSLPFYFSNASTAREATYSFPVRSWSEWGRSAQENLGLVQHFLIAALKRYSDSEEDKALLKSLDMMIKRPYRKSEHEGKKLSEGLELAIEHFLFFSLHCAGSISLNDIGVCISMIQPEIQPFGVTKYQHELELFQTILQGGMPNPPT